jgi:CubicO group peptidase (beta-lactamase class C family)
MHDAEMIENMLDRRQLFGGAAGLLALTALPAHAKRAVRVQDPLARRNNLGWDKVQAMFDGYVAEKKVPGLVAAVARGTDDASFIVSGTIARDDTRAMDPDSLFRIYSMTKPVTGMAIMMLIEEGKLKLDQNLSDILPNFANPQVLINPDKSLDARPAKSPITIRQLLTHTAGLGYNIVTKGPLRDEYNRLGITPGQVSRKPIPGIKPVVTAPSLTEFADRLAGLPLIADPGTIWSYSVSLDLLGRVIEVVSGMPFDAFLKTRIFEPLGMTSTYFQVPAFEAPRLTTNYGVSPFGKIPIDAGKDSIYLDKPPFPFGGAGLVSSARDYDRFLRMLAGYGAIGRTRIMKTETAKLGMSNLLPAGFDTAKTLLNGQGFGAGGRVTISATDPLAASIGTYGWGGAAATIAWVDPTKGVRASGYAQFMPDGSMPFRTDFGKAVYSSL